MGAHERPTPLIRETATMPGRDTAPGLTVLRHARHAVEKIASHHDPMRTVPTPLAPMAHKVLNTKATRPRSQAPGVPVVGSNRSTPATKHTPGPQIGP